MAASTVTNSSKKSWRARGWSRSPGRGPQGSEEEEAEDNVRYCRVRGCSGAAEADHGGLGAGKRACRAFATDLS